MGKKATVVWLVALALAPFYLAEAQQPKKVARIGYLSLRSPPAPSAPLRPSDEAFYQSLREAGYTEGKNLIVEYRYAESNRKRITEFATEFVSSKVDLIVAPSTPAIEAARKATTTIPIVMVSGDDPVNAEFIDSLSRPGGNITGVTGVVPALSGKLLQVLVDAIPRVARVGVLWHPVTGRQGLIPAEDTAQALRVRLKILEVRSLDEFEKAFMAMTQDRSRGLVILSALVFTMNQKRIAELSIKSRLPAIYWRREFAEVGGLLAYGPSLPDLYRRVGVLAGKVLNGTKPAELPVEQPTKYELVVNLMTAKQIGVTIPQSLLFRADEVIK
jgi:putative tryptophan/tyrosine transport system substrate-binding protein